MLFYQQRDGTFIPHLRLLHKYPKLLPHITCDKGAIKHVIGGANVMAPGLTSPGGIINDEVDVGDVVAIMAEGKKHAMGIGRMAMTPEDIKSQGKGQAIEMETHLCDALWTFKVE